MRPGLVRLLPDHVRNLPGEVPDHPDSPRVRLGTRVAGIVPARELPGWVGHLPKRCLVVLVFSAFSQDAASRSLLEHRRKLLDIVVMAVNLQRAWKSRTNTEKGAVQFEEGWAAMYAFATAHPAVHLKVDYLWNLRFEVLAINVT